MNSANHAYSDFGTINCRIKPWTTANSNDVLVNLANMFKLLSDLYDNG